MNQKRILVIDCHPNKDSFSSALAQAYFTGTKNTGAEIKTIVIRELLFNPNLAFGYLYYVLSIAILAIRLIAGKINLRIQLDEAIKQLFSPSKLLLTRILANNSLKDFLNP